VAESEWSDLMGFEYRVWFTVEEKLDIFKLVGRGQVPTDVEERDDLYLVVDDVRLGIKYRDYNPKVKQPQLFEIKKCGTVTDAGVEQWKKIYKDYVDSKDTSSENLWDNGELVKILSKFKISLKNPTPILITKLRRKVEIMSCEIEQCTCVISVVSPDGPRNLGSYQTIAIEGPQVIAQHLLDYIKSKNPVYVGSYPSFLNWLMKSQKSEIPIPKSQKSETTKSQKSETTKRQKSEQTKSLKSDTTK
jgi:hypothetical protein